MLTCLLYKHIQSALKSSAKHFNLDEAWVNTHSLRMSVPTMARAAREETSTILHMGRWKTVPSPMKYQEQSTAVNDHIISIANKPTLYTAEDILLSRILATRATLLIIIPTRHIMILWKLLSIHARNYDAILYSVQITKIRKLLRCDSVLYGDHPGGFSKANQVTLFLIYVAI